MLDTLKVEEFVGVWTNEYALTVWDGVTLTDRTRASDGSYNAYTATVEVLAADDDEATLVACQLAHAIRADLDPMVLGARITNCVA